MYQLLKNTAIIFNDIHFLLEINLQIQAIICDDLHFLLEINLQKQNIYEYPNSVAIASVQTTSRYLFKEMGPK